MIRHAAVTFLLLLLLTGCAGKVWDHPTKSHEDASRDAQACQQRAAQMTAAIAPGNLFYYQDQLAECLTAQGFVIRDRRPDDR